MAEQNFRRREWLKGGRQQAGVKPSDLVSVPLETIQLLSKEEKAARRLEAMGRFKQKKTKRKELLEARKKLKTGLKPGKGASEAEEGKEKSKTGSKAVASASGASAGDDEQPKSADGASSLLLSKALDVGTIAREGLEPNRTLAAQGLRLVRRADCEKFLKLAPPAVVPPHVHTPSSSSSKAVQESTEVPGCGLTVPVVPFMLEDLHMMPEGLPMMAEVGTMGGGTRLFHGLVDFVPRPTMEGFASEGATSMVQGLASGFPTSQGTFNIASCFQLMEGLCQQSFPRPE
eukprot:TRINITY_DN3789_c0_g2_i1.p1 TRINITY_DN3789_c0_g2~~TRINITY_DN3789_c0_g2_i1.p1  ORF type:complete len:322 (+),score=60.62 TRINITY_DN3789_c0_g2_i1:103-966(+)